MGRGNPREKERDAGLSEVVGSSDSEKALRASEEKYISLFEALDQGLMIAEVILSETDAVLDYRILEANARFEQLTGRSREEFIGKSVRELIPTLYDQWATFLGRVAASGQPVRFESYVSSLDLWLEVYAFSVSDPSYRRVASLFYDISSRRRAEQTLRNNERIQTYLLKLSDVLRPLANPIEIMSAAPEVLAKELDVPVAGYIEMSEDGDSIQMGGQFADGRMSAVIGPCKLSEFGEGYGPLLHAGREIFVTDVLAYTREPDSGTEKLTGFQIRAVAGTPLIKEGRLLGFFYAAHNAPRPWLEWEQEIFRQTAERTWAAVERARAETALRENEERFRLFLENVHEYALLQLDTRLRIASWNPGAERIFGYSSQEVLGQPFSMLLSPEDRVTGVPCMEISALESAGRNEDARWLVHKDGRRIWARWVTEPIRDKAGEVTGLAKVLRDETDRLQTETSLRQSEKLAVVGRMASSIAHEINNPLEAVTNLIYLARNCEISSDADQLLEQAERELARVSHIATATLHFHRQTSEPFEVDVEEILESVLLLHEGRLKATQITTERRYGPHPPIRCLANEIRQVFANLLSNAIDAMSKNGEPRRLILRIREAVDAKSGEHGVRVMIADTGSGIRESARKHVFEPFFTTKASTGTGLGLWISAETVKKHQGTLRFRSRTAGPYRGTVFSVFLGTGTRGPAPEDLQPVK